jgi:hypothetical protein
VNARTDPNPADLGATGLRFTWFNLVPWPVLSDDFRLRHRSVRVDIDSRLFDPAAGHDQAQRPRPRPALGELFG